MNLEELQRLTSKALEPAKQNLVEFGQVLPVLLTLTPDGRQKTIPVPDKFQLGSVIRKEKPHAFFYVSEVWIREDLTLQEQELNKTRPGWAEISKRVQEGRILAPSESPNRREGLMIIGGTGTIRVSLQQRFHRDGGKIVFEDHPEMAELKVGDSLVDWDDDAENNPSRLLTTAPAGGRIIHFDQPGFDIWIPEGWKMDWEPNSTDPQRSPIWHRDKDPHGAVRIRVFENKPLPGRSRDSFEEARAEAQKRREIDRVSDVHIDEGRQYPLLTWIQRISDPKLTRPWTLYAFKVFDAKGSILNAFNHFSDTERSVVQEELASVREIASRIARL
jgi:hypothetical protein